MRATIVVAPASPDADELRRIIAGWTAAGLLESSWWVTPSSESASIESIPRATHLSGGGEREVSLLESLAAQRLDLVRLVVVQLLPDASSADRTVVEFARSVNELFDAAIPGKVPRARINLVVPATGVSSVDPSVIMPGWETNAVASPEDRATGHRVNVLVRKAGNFVPHAAVELASVAGLWVGMDEGPFDVDRVESADGAGDPVLVRSFVRIARGGGIVDDVSRRALDRQGGEWPIPDGMEMAAIPAPSPAALVSRAVREASGVDNGIFEFQPAPQRPPLVQHQLGIWQTVKAMFSFFSRLVRGFPAYVVESIETKVRLAIEERATNFAFGEDSAFVVRQGASGEEAKVYSDPESLSLAATVDGAMSLLDDEGRSKFVVATPAAWSSLRQYAFGMVDGGALPSTFSTPQTGGHRELLTDPTHLVPSAAGERFVVPEDVCDLSPELVVFRGHELPPCDPFDANRVENALASAAESFRSREKPERERATRRTAEAEAARQRAMDRDGDEAAALLQDAERLAAEAQSAALAADAFGAKAQRVEEVLASLQADLSQRRKSFLWRLGSGIAQGITDAVDVLRAALPIVNDDLKIDWDIPKHARRSLLRWWSFLGISLVVVSALLFRAHPWPVAARLSAMVLVVAILLAFVVFARYHRRVHQFERQVDLDIHRLRQAQDDAYQAAGEVTRLGVVYHQYVEWAEIVGWLAHQPRATTDEHAPSEEADVETDALAQAIVIGEAAASDALMASLASRASKVISSQGWLSDLYLRGAARSMERLRRETGRMDADFDPDGDTPHVPTGARAKVVEDLRTETLQREARSEAVEAVTRYCENANPQDVFAVVTVPRDDRSEKEVLSVQEFLTDLLPVGPAAEPFATSSWSDRAQTRELHYVEQTLCWLPPALQPDGDPPQGVVPQTVETSTTDTGAYIVKSIRVDLSKTAALADFATFAARASTSTKPITDDGDKIY